MVAKLIELWSVRLPRWVDPWSPRLGDALADGAWTVPWPRVAAYAPVAALAVGFLAPALWPGLPHVFTESLLFMLLLVIGAVASGPVGVTMFIGYALGRLLVGSRLPAFGDPVARLPREVGSELISFALLAILAIAVPLISRRMARQIALDRLPPDPRIRQGARAALYAIGCGVLVYLWCQGTIVLIRPVFTWLGSQPTREAISPVQVSGGLLVMAAMITAAARVLIEGLHARRTVTGTTIMELEHRRRADGPPRGVWRRLPVIARIALVAVTVPFLLAGTYTSWIDPIVVAVATASLGAWRAGVIGRIPSAWTSTVTRVPALARLIAAMLIGQIFARAVLGAWLARDSFRPVMLGALLTLATFFALFPRRRTAQ